jgi:membrane-bound inhibitor of C-type lysozyme
MFSRQLTRSIIVGAAAIAVAGGSYGIVSATSSSSPAAASSGPASGPGSGGGGSNARSGPAAGGASGTVGSVSTSKFTVTTSAGQKVTVDEASSTTYQKGTSPATASAITRGEPVLVLGTVDNTTIAAAQVIVQPAGGGGSAASSAAKVIPFQRGAPTTSKQVGQIPANWSQGSGTIVSGTAANKATEAALAAYPGGIVDRVVKLGNGEYNVHYIGVNWPHHVFVNQDFKVVGAE